MSGQGTVGLEIADELDRRRIIPDHLVLNVSGGGLAAGVSEALRNRFETLDISIVEPSGRNKMAHTLSKTTDPYRAPVTSTVMDALAGPTVGKHTRYALARHKPRTLTVSDTQALSLPWLQPSPRCDSSSNLAAQQPWGPCSPALRFMLVKPSS